MKISEILKSTDTPQITGDLIRYKWKFDDERGFESSDLEGKCALGVLACESGNPLIRLSKTKKHVAYETILDAYGIDDQHSQMPMLVHPDNLDYNPKKPWNFEEHCQLSTIIIRLNDTYKLNFAEIGEFLEITFDL